jgi:RNA ligase (TIGR02306 family)
MNVDDAFKHPDADRLTIVKIRGYSCISNLTSDGSPRYKANDLVVYIPEGAVVPEWLLKKMDFWDGEKGILAGSKGDRVKAIKLRGIVSQGILYPVINGAIETSDGSLRNVTLGENVAEFLGVKKYEPIIPSSMSGEVTNLGTEYTLKFDIENIQKYPNVFADGEEVVFTEKLHGTFCGLAVNGSLQNDNLVEGKFYAFSKGLGAQGLVFKDNEANAHNVYQKTLRAYLPQLKQCAEYVDSNSTLFVLGEVYGSGIQDLNYDGVTEIKFRFFAVAVKSFGTVNYLSESQLEQFTKVFDRVPVLYRGPFSMAKVNELKNGKTTIGSNIREGLVITPVVERQCVEFGRVALKAISAEYLLRKGGTEFN